MDAEERRAADICARRDDSLDWQSRNYYSEYEDAWRAYKCEKEPELDLDNNEDRTITTLGMPDTFGYVRRAVARGTAQPPKLGFKSESGHGELIGHTLMSQWDRGGTQRWQKLHFLQTALFGWSVKAWHWAEDTFQRKRKVDPMTPGSWAEIKATYEVDLASMPDEQRMPATMQLIEQYGRGGMYIPVSYEYTAYEGPRSDVLLIADCFPQPGFRDIQSCEYFIVERRRNLEWIKRAQNYYKETRPDVANALHELLEKYPTGTHPSHTRESSGRGTNFRTFLERAVEKPGLIDTSDLSANTKQWTFYEEHRPGARPRLTLVAERDHFIGEVDYPYELEGRIAFTEAVLIDDLVSGIGDSVPRILRGLQRLHDRLVCRRADLVDSILRPLVGTTDRRMWQDAAQQLKRGKGMRLLYMPGGPNSMWTNNESPAIAAVVSALNEEGAYMRAYQTGTGETNMSMSANVDPQQNRTATGARLSAAIGDILTQDVLHMFGHSIRADAQMMYLLNRSEMTRDFRIDMASYRQSVGSGLQDPLREQWVNVSPLDFQHDGDITFEENSTLAADDERNVTKAVTMWQMFSNRTDVNQQRLISDNLTSMGKGREVQEYLVPPQQPPPEPPIRGNVSFSGQDLLAFMQAYPPLATSIMSAAGIGPAPDQKAQSQGGPPAPQPTPEDISPEMLQALMEQQANPATSTLDAAAGGGNY